MNENHAANSSPNVIEDKFGIGKPEDVDMDEDLSEDVVTSTQDLCKNLVVKFDNAAAVDKFGKNKGTERPPMVPTGHPTSQKRSHQAAVNDTCSTFGGKNNRKTKSQFSVFLRVRNPVVTESRINSSDDCLNTVEILKAPTKTKATYVRTYPPADSSTAKSLRASGNGKYRNCTRNQINRVSNDIARGSTFDETSCGIQSLAAGVKEFHFNRVFGPDSTQEVVYNDVAAPLVDGLFPKNLGCHEDGKSPARKKCKSDEGNVAVPNVDASSKIGDVNKGHSSLLFAYGITNAGKTYTIMGNNPPPKTKHTEDKTRDDDVNTHSGILPRALRHVFSKIKEEKEANLGEANNYKVQMSYLEIYNDKIYDLLGSIDDGYDSVNSASSKNRTRPVRVSNVPVPLKLREDRNGHIFVHRLSKHPITSLKQGLDLANLAKDKRHTSSNNINSDSSRSHCICQIELVTPAKVVTQHDNCMADNNSDNISVTSSLGSNDLAENSVSMWIVDLAGSERSKRTGMISRSIRQKEAMLINASLMKLMHCIRTIQTNQQCNSKSSSQTVVPFRECKLTHLFMNHLTGASGSRISMVVNVNPAAVDYDETQHVLDYAAVARSVQISHEDFQRKIKAIAMGEHSSTNKNQVTYGSNGRPVIPRVSNDSSSNSRNSSLSQHKALAKSSNTAKIVKIATKLSPRALLKKKRQERELSQVRKEELRKIRGIAGGKTMKNTSTKQGEWEEIMRKYKSDKKNISTSLEEALTKIKEMEEEMDVMKEEQECREREIRREVAEEMEAEFRTIRDHYETLSERNEKTSNPTPMKTLKTLEVEKQEELIASLRENIDECEDEIERMRENHEKALKSKDEEIAALQNLYEEAKEENEAELEQMKEELERIKEVVEEKNRSNDNLKQELKDAQLKLERCDSNDAIRNTVSMDFSLETENTSSDDEKAKKSRVRRLPRNRCSEVACADIADIEDQSKKNASSKKKKGYSLRSRSGTPQ